MTAVAASCGCLAGSEYTGWQEIRSSYCKSEETRQFGMAMDRIQKMLAERREKK